MRQECKPGAYGEVRRNLVGMSVEEYHLDRGNISRAEYSSSGHPLSRLLVADPWQR